ncbi:MAG: HAMP domain-containing histidine kinase, partial [Calditrichia bacterium]|nr:HAMP domain-containing histidine kinase [Calditrichia bacterium]
QTFPEIVDVKAIIQEVLSLVEYMKKNIEINLDVNENEIKIDPNHFKQILTNILVNSISVMDNNGKITISTYKRNNKFCLKVSDNGPGISAENKEKIFQPFFTTKEDGTGLGLSICKKLCEQNGFEIMLENNKGIGCSFVLKSN